MQTNNATFGHTAEAVQQLAMTRLRAIEHGRATVQVSTVGVSAIIRPDGSIVDDTKLFTREVMVARVPLRDARTLADRVGSWPEAALSLLAVLGLVLVCRTPAPLGCTAYDALALGRVLVVTPTYDERPNIGPVVARLRAAVPYADVLIVDDNSPDGTGEVADELAAADPAVHVLHRPGKVGLGAAYVAGFQWGLSRDYDVLVEMDADGSHQPEQLPSLLLALEDADLVLGSRWVAGGSVSDWPATADGAVAGRQHLRAALAGAGAARRDRRFPGVPP